MKKYCVIFLIAAIAIMAGCVGYTTRIPEDEFSKSSSLLETLKKYYPINDKDVKYKDEYHTIYWVSLTAPDGHYLGLKEKALLDNLRAYCNRRGGIFQGRIDKFTCGSNEITLFEGNTSEGRGSGGYSVYFSTVIEEAKSEYAEINKKAIRTLREINIVPQIIDESGFYEDKAKAIEVESDKNYFLPTNLKGTTQFEVVVKVPTSEYNLSIELNEANNKTIKIIEKSSYKNRFTGRFEFIENLNDYSIKPEIKIKSKNFDQVRPKGVFKDKNLAVEIKKIEAAFGDRLYAELVFTNLTRSYLTIDTVGLHINDSILVLKTNINLAPKALIEKSFHIRRDEVSDTSIFNRAYETINVSMTKSQLSVAKLNMGISTKYHIGGAENNLYQSRDYLYSEILE
jgi:hypothetical protein